MYQVNDIHGMIMRYTGETSFVAVFLLVLVYFYVNNKELYRKRMTIIIILSFVLIFNNLMLRVVGSVIGYSTYYRFFWAVPVVLSIAGAIVKIFDVEKVFTRKLVLAVLIALVLSIGGNNVKVLTDAISLPTNRYNIPREVIEVAYIINKDREVERAVIVANSEVKINIRQYDPSFIWGVRRNAFMSMHRSSPYDMTLDTLEHIIVRVVEFGRQVPEEKELFIEAIEKKGVDYIISLTGFNLDKYMEQVGFTVIERTTNNTVYGRK